MREHAKYTCILNFKEEVLYVLLFLDLGVGAMHMTNSVCEFAVESSRSNRWTEFALLMFMGTKLGLREKGTKDVTEFLSFST